MLHQLADGVYAAIATDTGASYSNAGLIDLGDQILVFDSFEHPQAAKDLRKASSQLMGRKPITVVLSHWHPDHWGGLQVFSDRTILATDATRQAMIPIAKEMMQAKNDVSEMERDLRETKERFAMEADPNQRRVLQITVARLRYDLKTVPRLRPALPNQTFDGKIAFHGLARSAELIVIGRGHTESDCVLRLPKDRIAFIGDLGFFQSQPFMPYGFPREWLVHLSDMTNWKIKTFVPGHGPLGSKKDILLEAKYIRALESMVKRVIQRGGTLRDALNQTLPPPFDDWQRIGSRFEANVRGSFKRQSRKSPA
jgi:cyclase